MRWFDASAATPRIENASRHQVDWVRTAPFIGVHLMCLGVIWVGWSWVAVGVAALLYAIRMFAVTGIYHRYFSHRTYKTSRPMQFALALLANTATQRGPLWWAAHHRQHHLYSDTENDVHSPRIHGFIWSQIGWITDHRNFPTKLDAVRDLAKFPELRFLDRFDTLVPFVAGASMYYLGAALSHFAPGLHTSAMQMLIWGFFVSTVVLFHATSTINSLAHQMGRRRFDTGDDSRNSLLLALLTFGEGWHNNHHHFPATVHQGFYWWEIDITYYLLRALSWTGLIWDLKPVPAKVKDLNRYEAEAAA
ncbi:MAG TPA: acyl-CoA desaturase [Terriglobia bacterium]|nr:acyl-CoA desaturase [Terriglobia bacterium]